MSELLSHFGNNVKVRFSVDFLMTTSLMMILPYLPIYFSHKVGASLTGFMFAIVIICGITGGVTGGMLADRIGRRKVMLISESVTIVMYTLIALCNSPWADKPYLTFLFFAIGMIFSGMINPAVSALLIDSSEPEYRKLMYQIQYWLINVAVAIGSLIGGLFFQHYYFILFSSVVVANVIGFLSTVFFITDEYKVPNNNEGTGHVRDDQENSGLWKNLSDLIKDRLFLLFFLAAFSIATVSNQMVNYIAIHMSHTIPRQNVLGDIRLDGVNLLGVLQSENALLVIVLTFFVTYFVRKMNSRFAVIFGTILFASGYVYMMLGNTPWLFILAMFITTIGELLYVPIEQNFLADLAPEDKRGLYIGIGGLNGSFGMIAASLMITVSQFLPPMIMAMVVGFMGLLAAILFGEIDARIKEKIKLQSKSADVKM